MFKFSQEILFGFTFERETNLYEKIGVRQLKKIVPCGDFWIMLYNKLFFKKLRIVNSEKDAIVWVIFTLSVELLHFIGFIIILWFTIQSAIYADYYKVLKFTGINVIVNVYPIIIQRYNRIRISEIYKITLSDLKTFEL